MPTTIEVDDQVYETLRQKAEPFVDTPNSVLRRVLGISGTETEQNGTSSRSAAMRATVAKQTGIRAAKRSAGRDKAAPRAARGTLLPEAEYEIPILEYLDGHGGRAPSREVTEAVGQVLAGKLTDADQEPLNSGEIRWKSRAAFVRLRLIEKGDLSGHAPRGTWEISDQGRERLRSTR